MAGGSVFGFTKGTWAVALGGTIFRDQGMESLCLYVQIRGGIMYQSKRYSLHVKLLLML